MTVELDLLLVSIALPKSLTFNFNSSRTQYIGTYGNFEIMPLLCPGGFITCTTTLAARERLRKPDSDGMSSLECACDILCCWTLGAIDASPGYFSLTLNNSIKMEATATRRAGLERFTFPSGSKPYFVLDLANDLPGSFKGGQLTIDPDKGRITIGGRWGSRFDMIITMMPLLIHLSTWT